MERVEGGVDCRRDRCLQYKCGGEAKELREQPLGNSVYRVYRRSDLLPVIPLLCISLYASLMCTALLVKHC